MRNVQHRVIEASADTLGALLDAAATPNDRLWPAPGWPALILDAGLTPGSRGGHGPIRYRVAAYEPGRRVSFDFEPGSGFDGYHELSVGDHGAGRSILTHTLVATTSGRMVPLWPLMIRWLHEALIEDLFDNAELAATRRLSRPSARWSWWVRQLRRVPL
jgi:hypothetical protein